MKEVKDSEIKLFGMNIAFTGNGRVVPVKVSTGEGGGNDERIYGFDLDFCLREKKVCEVGEEVEVDEENNTDISIVEENQNSIAEDVVLSEVDDNVETLMNEDSITLDPSKNEKNQSDTTSVDQNTMKKPDKILPCPRCDSMDTKFCYHNNYNVNQPRHFCKRCQRYWTAGGTMRNVPVGAGRRKSKNPVSHSYHREFNHHNDTLLSFGIDSNAPNGTRNECYNQDRVVSIPCKGRESGDDCSSETSVTTSNSMANGGQNQPQSPVIQNINNIQSPIPCVPGVSWPYMWNPSVPMPTVFPSGFSMPFYPVPYWNYNVPNPWSTPWLSPTSSTDQNSSKSETNSTILGKHSRDGELLKQNTPKGKEESSNRSILVPKTLRVDDPEEAAKSSIWATLGIIYDSDNKRRTMFNAFEPKYVENNYTTTITSRPLEANPAALSRSLNFQEIA